LVNKFNDLQQCGSHYGMYKGARVNTLFILFIFSKALLLTIIRILNDPSSPRNSSHIDTHGENALLSTGSAGWKSRFSIDLIDTAMRIAPLNANTRVKRHGNDPSNSESSGMDTDTIESESPDRLIRPLKHPSLAPLGEQSSVEHDSDSPFGLLRMLCFANLASQLSIEWTTTY
jgi:hypothetical protein